MIEIYEATLNTIWNDQETYLVVFDKDGNQVTDYDFSTGLRLIQDDEKMTVFVNDKEMAAGMWKFFGTTAKQIEPAMIQERVYSEGISDGDNLHETRFGENPWNSHRNSDKYVSFAKRSERIGICRSCPLLLQSTGECSVDGKNVIELTKLKKAYCPVEKWGDKNSSLYYMRPRGEESEEWIKEEQKDFERELEDYLDN